MDFTNLLVVLVTVVVGKCSGQGSYSTSSMTTSSKNNISSPSPVPSKGTPSVSDVTTSTGPTDLTNGTTSPGQFLTTASPVWVRCTTGVELEELANNNNIAKVMTAWCKNYKKIIDCLSRDIATSAPDNSLDFFINLTFNKVTLRSKSDSVCSKFKEKKDKISCADSSNETLTGVCAADFSGGMTHVFSLHKEKDLPPELLREVACDVVLQTTFCLRDTLSECQEDVQAVLLSYYALFTNESCLAKERPQKQETVAAKCAREAALTLQLKQPGSEPKSLLDFLILGLKTDCETFSVRFACYKRELTNITNFRDFWLSLTFDHDNAVNSQKVYCEQVDKQVIPGITSKCFNKSQPGLATCEVGFAREVEAIREEWFKNPEFDGLQLQTLACRTSVTRAACLDNAMQPCGSEVSRAMAFSEIGILPDICRRLLTAKTAAKSDLRPALGLENNTESNKINQTSNETQILSNIIGEFDLKQESLDKYEMPLADEAAKDSNFNESAGHIMEEEYVNNQLKEIEVTTPVFENDTMEQEVNGGSVGELRDNQTDVKGHGGHRDQSGGNGIALIPTLVEIFLGVFVSGLFYL